MSNVEDKGGEIMKFSQYYPELNGKKQSELDFLDGLINKDVPFYIDPLLIEKQAGDWYAESARLLRNFFDTVFKCYREGRISEAEALLTNAREPNETRLGVSLGNPQGRGTSTEGLKEIFDNINRSGLLDDVIGDYKELNLYVEDFAEDRMSDLVTNILRGQLAEFTAEQGVMNNLNLTDEPIELGMGWDPDSSSWQPVISRALIPEGKLLLLIPKTIIVKKYLYSIGGYFSRTIYKWRQDYHVKNETNLSKRTYVKTRNEFKIEPPSQDVIDEIEIKGGGYKGKKDYAIDAIRQNRNLIIEFSRVVNHAVDGTNTNRLTDEEIMNTVEMIQGNEPQRLV